MTGADPVEGAELVTGPLLVTLERPGVGTIVVTTRRLTTLRTRTGRGRGGLAGAELVGEEGEHHREERDRAPDHERRSRLAAGRTLSHRDRRPSRSPSIAAGDGRRRRRWCGSPPGRRCCRRSSRVAAVEPALEPLVWVTTGVAWEPPPEVVWDPPPEAAWGAAGVGDDRGAVAAAARRGVRATARAGGRAAGVGHDRGRAGAGRRALRRSPTHRSRRSSPERGVVE